MATKLPGAALAAPPPGTQSNHATDSGNDDSIKS